MSPSVDPTILHLPTGLPQLRLKVTRGDEEAGAWEGWLRIRAERLVTELWDQITAVAEALRDRKTLNGSEVRQIVFPAALKWDIR